MSADERILRLRLTLGSHLARHLRHEVERHKGYTATVGIATNKIVSKLVGNVNKPMNQTTILPPFEDVDGNEGSVTTFMDAHDIGKIPGIGFKLAQKVRAHILGREAKYDFGLVYGGTKENVTVYDVRHSPGMGPQLLEELLSGPGSQKGIGGKMWAMLHGIDDSEVGMVKKVPSQISQEDSYMKYLHTFEQVRQQLLLLGERLIRRMHIDLVEEEEVEEGIGRRWLAHPRTLRLSTRPRPPLAEDGTRTRTFNRISRSSPMPNFAFNMQDSTSSLAIRLVDECLVPMFRKLHPQRHGWNLSLINVAVTNMAETAADNKDSEGRDIARMFRRQDDVLKDFRVTDDETFEKTLKHVVEEAGEAGNEREVIDNGDVSTGNEWSSDDEMAEAVHRCPFCSATVPLFAAAAHERFHSLKD